MAAHSRHHKTVQGLREKAQHWRWLGRQIDDLGVRKTLLDAAHDYEQEAFALEREK
jgi:hypothetical protein